MINVLFFAQTRELIGIPSLYVDIQSITVGHLRRELCLRGDSWLYALGEKSTLCAVNKQLVDDNYLIHNGDEVAFFPPVTGG